MNLCIRAFPLSVELFDKKLIAVDNIEDALPRGERVKEEEEILDSWKAISNYLEKDIRTCSRWEKKLGLPIHRYDDSSSRSKVFAYKSEIDQWLKQRAVKKEIEKKSLWENRWVIAGLLLLSLVAIRFAFMLFPKWISSLRSPENLSIAVFPFENHNSSEYDEYFSEGITNEIIQNITRLSELKVIPAKPPAKNLQRSESPEDMAEDLGVDFFLKGRMEKNGDKIRLYVQLIRAKDEQNIWDGKFDGRLEDIFAIQENICKKINEILRIAKTQKGESASPKGGTHDYEAYDAYLKGSYILSRLSDESDDTWKLYHQGKYYWGKCTKESNELAINLFNQAIKIDSRFALAYIGLAHCYANYVNLFWDYNRIWLDKAEDLLKKARTISADLPEYYSTLIEIYLLKESCFNEETKGMAFELAQEGIQLFPNDAQLNSIVGYCYFQKYGEEGHEADFERALEYKEKSFWLNPYAISNIVYAEFLMLNRDFHKALEVCNVIERNDPSLMARFRLGEIYYYMGELEKSKAIFQEFENAVLGLKIHSLLYLGMIAAQQGKKDEALGIVEEVKRISPEKFIMTDYLKISSIYMALGMEDLGLKYLEIFFYKYPAKKIAFIYYRYINIDKNFDNVREKEKFQKIIKGEGSWPRAKPSG